MKWSDIQANLDDLYSLCALAGSLEFHELRRLRHEGLLAGGDPLSEDILQTGGFLREGGRLRLCSPPSLRELRALLANNPALRRSATAIDEWRASQAPVPGSPLLRARARQALALGDQALFSHVFLNYGGAKQLGWFPDRDHQIFWRDVLGDQLLDHDLIEDVAARMEVIVLLSRRRALGLIGELPAFPSYAELPVELAHLCAELEGFWLARRGDIHRLRELVQQQAHARVAQASCLMMEGDFHEAHRGFSGCFTHTLVGLQIIQHQQLEATLILGILNAILRKASASVVQKWLTAAEQSLIDSMSPASQHQHVLEELELLDLVLNRDYLPSSIPPPSEQPLVFFLRTLALSQLPHSTDKPSADDILRCVQALAAVGEGLFAHYLSSLALSHHLVQDANQLQVLLSFIHQDIAPLPLKAKRRRAGTVAAQPPTEKFYWDILLSPQSSEIQSIEARLLTPYHEREKRGRHIALEQIKMGHYDEYLCEQDRELLPYIEQDFSASQPSWKLTRHAFASLAQHPRVRIGQVGSTTRESVILEAEQAQLQVQLRDEEMIIRMPRESDFYHLQAQPDGRYRILCHNERLEKLRIALGAKPEQNNFTLPKKAHPRLFENFKSLHATHSRDENSATEPMMPEQLAPQLLLHYHAETLHLRLSFRIHPDSPLYHKSKDGVEQVKGRRIQRVKSDEDRILDDLLLECPSLRIAPTSPHAWSWDISGLPHCLQCYSEIQAYVQRGAALDVRWQGGENLQILGNPCRAIALQFSGSSQDWFSVAAELELENGTLYSIDQLLRLYEQRVGSYLPLGEGQFLPLHSSQLRQLLFLSESSQRKGAVHLIPRSALLTLTEHWDAEDLPADVLAQASLLQTLPSWQASEQLHATLRPYQEQGVQWLIAHAQRGLGCCLADDMGLGKTIQIISLLLNQQEDGASLIIAPLSLLRNWASEIARFAPSLRVHQLSEMKQDLAELSELASGDICLASYGQLLHRPALAEHDWNGLILDEAQAIKNPRSKRGYSVRKLRASFRVCVTGTPVENHLSDLWSLMQFLNPGHMGKLHAFLQRAKNPESRDMIHSLLAPLILRRRKEEVLQDLPSLTEITVPITLSESERHLYEAVRRRALRRLGDQDDSSSPLSVLAELTKLRRLCCHPSLIHPDFTRSAKLDKLMELLHGLKENAHKVLVFSQYTDVLKIVSREIEEQFGSEPLCLDGSTPAAERDRLVQQFQAPQQHEHDFFLISLKAGGSGLNLTAADFVILLDPWWNPATESQAAARAHRMGQQRPVTLYRLVCKNSVEERIMKLHEQKQELIDQLDYLSQGELHELLCDDAIDHSCDHNK